MLVAEYVPEKYNVSVEMQRELREYALFTNPGYGLPGKRVLEYPDLTTEPTVGDTWVTIRLSKSSTLRLAASEVRGVHIDHIPAVGEPPHHPGLS